MVIDLTPFTHIQDADSAFAHMNANYSGTPGASAFIMYGNNRISLQLCWHESLEIWLQA